MREGAVEVYNIGEGCVTISIHAIGGGITGKDVKTHGKSVLFQESSTFCHRDSEPYPQLRLWKYVVEEREKVESLVETRAASQR